MVPRLSDRPAAAERFGRQESPEERADRRWGDMLQEVRVAQTGSQILFGFLLSVVFMPRFEQLTGFDQGLYVVTVVLGALATGALVAPVSYHRVLAGHQLKPQLVDGAARLISFGLVLLALTVGAALLLLLRVATGGSAAAWVITGIVLLWFVLWWLVLPLRRLVRHNGNGAGDGSGDPRNDPAPPDGGRRVRG
ncbi:DUF6328 family protein [Kitasatospora sp. NPDC054939]